jgi:hypothetical protein
MGMKALDFRDRFLLILSNHSAWANNEEISYQQWLALKKEIDYLMADTGSEARCVHAYPLYNGIICILCGRKPNNWNTFNEVHPLPPEAA